MKHKFKNQIKLDNINLIKALLNQGVKKEFNQEPKKVWGVGYEFYKFCEVFEQELFKKYCLDRSNKNMDFNIKYFPAFCFGEFANAYNNYKEKQNEVY